MAVNEAKQLTKVEQEAADKLAVDNAVQVVESRKFLRRNPDFPVNLRSAEVMKRELQRLALDWTEENLTHVWNTVDRDRFDKSENKRPPAVDPLPDPEPSPEPVETFAWGKKLEGPEGIARVLAMPKDEMLKYMKNRHYGREFSRQVDSLGITREQLRHNGEI